jgi:pantoate--beta-alanine ligase
MRTLTTPQSARQFVLDARTSGQSVGIVPTMGALHEGHLSLVRMSRASCDQTVATIFVNPPQFAEGEDLDKYPRTFDRDRQLLAAEGVAAVFVPTTDALYPAGFSTFIEPPTVAQSLEGTHRPQHFRGVATIVLKLFHALPATHAFFGRKDYQQLKVIEAMTRDLDVGIEIVAGDTVREPDGLAMSSRNRYLDSAHRRRALRISQSLDQVTGLVESGQRDVDALTLAMRTHLLGAPSTSATSDGVDHIDYAVIVDAENLSPISQLDRQAVALIAVRVGSTRLIDNRILPAV